MSILLFSILFILLISISLSTSYAETWKVEIPGGAANPEGPAHFLPTEISIRPGDKVQWGNADTVTHTATSGTLTSGVTEQFDSGHMEPGSGFTVFFDETDVGEIKYFCTIHPWMIGVVNVVELPADYKIIHNVGSNVSDSPIDVSYKVQRHLVSVDVDVVRNSLTFNFEGKIGDDEFVVQLPEKLIKDPNSVWINDKQTTNYEITQTDGIDILAMTLGDDVEQVKIVGTDVIGTKTSKEIVLINQLSGITDKKSYEIDDEIIVSGEIQNPVQLYELSLDVISPKEVTVYHKIVPLIDSTKFSEIIPIAGSFREIGEYTIKISGPDVKSLFLSFEYGVEHKMLPLESLSPKKQMNSGICSGDVSCNEDLVLLMKNSNGNAICVTESTADALMIRGYADYF